MSDHVEKTNPSHNHDQRYLPRWEVQNQVTYHLDDHHTENKKAVTKDLSCAGACIRTVEPISLDHPKVKMTIQLSSQSFISVDGQVRWVKPVGFQNLVGITFNSISDKDQETILKHAFELNPRNLSNHWFQGWQ